MNGDESSKHTCKKMPSDVVIEKQYGRWVLTVRTACTCCAQVTFADLFNVKYCPYCGELLTKSKEKI